MVNDDRTTNHSTLGTLRFRGAKPAAAIVVGLALLVALAGCAGAEPGAGSGVTLAQSKSPVQFLRNETTSRIPSGSIDSLVDSTDRSVECLTEEEDPKGLIRQWSSTSVAIIERASEWRTAKIGKDLVQSLVDEGWTARDAGSSAAITRTLLTSTTSVAEIKVTSKIPNDTNASTSQDEEVTDYRIEIETHGPCVETDGPQSDEVATLEAAH